MSETEIGNIDYTTIDVDKHVTYDSLEGRVVIITGGGQGIGRGYAHYFAAQGAIPVIAEYNGDNGERVAKEIQDKQGRALAVQTDVADIESATAMAEKTLSELGRIDVLINNAAVFSAITMAPFWELRFAEWVRAVQVNINGAFYCSRAVVPKHMFEVLTGNQALPRQGTIHDLAKAMLFLCSDEAAYITGQSMLPDGGQVFL